MPRVYVLVNPHDRQQRDFDVDPDVIVGVRRRSSGWVDTSDPFIYMVGQPAEVSIYQSFPTAQHVTIFGVVQGIARVDIRDLTEGDAKEASYRCLARFFEGWVALHDPNVNRVMSIVLAERPVSPEHAAEAYRHCMIGRNSALYQAWELTLERHR